jgi:hypothetical protein
MKSFKYLVAQEKIIEILGDKSKKKTDETVDYFHGFTIRI